jgi:hypothetical protein
MPRRVVWFPAYRDFETSRVEANDALMSLLLGNHLARDELDNSKAAPALLLGRLYEGIPQVARFNVPLSVAREALVEAEQHFAQMAIPTAVTVHEVYVRNVVKLLKDAGKDPPTRAGKPKHVADPADIKLYAVHDYAAQCAQGARLDTAEMRLFRWLRHVRNAIVHTAGYDHQGLAKRYASLRDRGVWKALAERDFALRSDGRCRLGEGEVIATLAITDRLAQDVNRMLVPPAIDARWWADYVVKDYRTSHPERYRSTGRRDRRVEGFARQYYSLLKLTSAELVAAVARASK